MKKILILFMVLLIANVTYAQKKFSWSTISCYPQVSIGIVNDGYSKNAGGYLWGVAIKNVTSKTLQISYRLSVGGERYAGGGFQPTRYLAPGESWLEGESLFSALLFKSSSTSWNIELKDLCYQGDDCFKLGYIDCGGQRIGGKGGSDNNSTNSNSNTSTSGTIDEQLKELTQKRNDLCREVAQFDKNTYDNICDSWQGRDPIQSKEQSLFYLKEDIRKLENVVNANSKNGTSQSKANEKALAESKAAEQKAEKFSEYMNSGESALNNSQFDNAISNFTNAQQFASSEQEMLAAGNAVARAQKAKADAARVVRTTEKRKVEQQQNDATIAAASSFAGIMAMINDAHSPGKFAAKFQVGLGYGSTGIITNSAFNQKSTIKSSNQALFMLGLKLGFANNRGISFQLNPLVNIGVNALQLGIDGSSTTYGGTGTLFIAKKALSKIKLFAEAGYLNTTGIYNYDQAVAEGVNSTSDNVEEATYEYSTIKYGGGLMFNLIADGKETFIKPGIFFETPSFLQKPTKPVMVGNLQVNIVSFILLDVSYSKNYFIPGRIGYKNNFKTEDKNFWSIKLIRQGKLK